MPIETLPIENQITLIQKGIFMQANINTSISSHVHLQWKKDDVVWIEPDAPLWEASQLMREHQIGDLVVMSGRGQPRIMGMITDRDIALSLSDAIDFKSLRVADVMSSSVVSASMSDDLFKIIQLMKDSGVTRLPMLDSQGQVAGVVTAKNILQILVNCFFDVTQISERQQENESTQQH
jgi:CBS domain-containing protein